MNNLDWTVHSSVLAEPKYPLYNKLQDLRKQETSFPSSLLYMHTHLLMTTTVCLHSQNPGTDQKQELKHVNSPLQAKQNAAHLERRNRVSTFTS